MSDVHVLCVIGQTHGAKASLAANTQTLSVKRQLCKHQLLKFTLINKEAKHGQMDCQCAGCIESLLDIGTQFGRV